jgi:L-2-hydroxycarboxylate dehydrogenase (NAD+)
MPDQDFRVPVDVIRSFMEDVFRSVGVPDHHAAIIADILLASDLRGIESHGTGRLKMYYDRIKDGRIDPKSADMRIVKESPTTAVIDGGHGMGHVVAHRAMTMAMDKAAEFGMGSVAVRNSTHFGIDGYYPLMAIKRGMIGFSVTNARPSIAPTFGVEPMLGTNPIAFGAPSDEDCPFLFDGATSITQRGKVEVLNRKGLPTPSGWIIDDKGNPATESADILAGLVEKRNALLPLGGFGEALSGHKGFGLSVIVELLSASLQDGAYLRGLSGLDADGNPARFRVGHFFLAIDIEHFVPLETFKHTTGNILRDLRGSTKSPGHDRIWTAGEKEWENEARIAVEGVPINSNLRAELAAIRDELGLTEYAETY